MSENNYDTISFIIPTIGRPSLQQTLDSIDAWEGDEVLVIKHDPPSGNWGNDERQDGTNRATCQWLAYIDDDDWYVPNHRKIMDNAIKENPNHYPVMFQMRYPSGRLLWNEKKIKCGNIGAPMFLVPNIKKNLHKWEPARSAADFIFADKWAWPARLTIWREEVIALAGHNDEKYENAWSYSEAKKKGYKLGK